MGIFPVAMKLKTHKDQGEIVPRLLHTSQSHPVRPAMFWAANELKSFPKSQPRLVGDSSALARKVKTLRIPPTMARS